MATLEVKGIDDDLYVALRERARRHGRSVGQEVILLIQEYLAHPAEIPGSDARREFLALAGSWEDDRSAETITEDIRGSRRNRACPPSFPNSESPEV